MIEKRHFFHIYDNLFSSLKLYWSAYGGWSSLVKSPYLHIALLISILCYPVSLNAERPWYALPLGILPNFLGFTLGGFAILLAFGNERFLMILSVKKDETINSSPFMDVIGAFSHFIVIQVFCIVYSVICFSWNIYKGFFAFFGFTSFVYSIFSGIAATFSILRLGKWYDIYLRNKFKRERSEKEALSETEN